MTNPNERARGTSRVKKYPSHGSHRITPPEPVRNAVAMDPDEPWSWYWHAPSERFILRRAGATLEGIPDDVRPFGTAVARQNGNYLDFAIPPEAVHHLGLAKGDPFEFVALDANTIYMIDAGADTDAEPGTDVPPNETDTPNPNTDNETH